MFGVAAAAKKQPLQVEKTNKSELWNRLTYRVLIYIFEVGMKTFFLKWEISRSKSQFDFFFWKNGLFFEVGGWIFLSPSWTLINFGLNQWNKVFSRMLGFLWWRSWLCQDILWLLIRQWLINGKNGQGAHSTNMGANKLTQNVPNHICPKV